MNLRKTLAAGAIAALMGTGLVAASVMPAAAHQECNQWGHCWYVPDHNGFGVYFHSGYDRWHHYDHDRGDYWRHRGYDHDWRWHHEHDDYDR